MKILNWLWQLFLVEKTKDIQKILRDSKVTGRFIDSTGNQIPEEVMKKYTAIEMLPVINGRIQFRFENALYELGNKNMCIGEIYVLSQSDVKKIIDILDWD